MRPTFRPRKRLEIDAAYTAFLIGGMALADYPGETIQCRNELDRTNWFELRDMCRQAITAEKAAWDGLPPTPVWGNYPITAPGIRCTSNRYVQPTVAATLVMMSAVSGWALVAQANWWRMKDLCDAATTDDDLRAINLDEGWP